MTKSKVNFQFMPWTQEGKLERQIQRDLELRQQDEEWRERRRQEARLDAPVTRRELLAALEHVRNNAGCNTADHWNAIEMTLRDLIGELE